MSKTSQISKTQPCSFLKAYGPLCNTGACSPCIGTAHTRGVSPGRDTLSRKTHNTNAFFCTAFPRHKKDAGCGGGPKSSNSSAKTCHGGCVLGGCGGPSTRRPQFAYLHTLILLSHVITAPATSTLTETPCLIARPATQTLFLPHLARARAPTLIFFTHILATPATPTSTQHFTYILATPATHRITYAHIFWRRLPRRNTNTKNENKTKKTTKNFHKVWSNASLEALP